MEWRCGPQCPFWGETEDEGFWWCTYDEGCVRDECEQEVTTESVGEKGPVACGVPFDQWLQCAEEWQTKLAAAIAARRAAEGGKQDA